MAKMFTAEQVLQLFLEEEFDEWWEEEFSPFQSQVGEHKNISFADMTTIIEGKLSAHPAERPLYWGEASALLTDAGWSLLDYKKEIGNEYWIKENQVCILIVDPGSSDHRSHKKFTPLADSDHISFDRVKGEQRWVIAK